MPNLIARPDASLVAQIPLTKQYVPAPHDNAARLPAAFGQFSAFDAVRSPRATFRSMPVAEFATLCPEEYGINQPHVDLDSP